MTTRELLAFVFGGAMVAAGCSTAAVGSDNQASCPQAFYVNDADAGGAAEGALPNDQCAALCGKVVFSCAIASVDAGSATIECQPSCSTAAYYGSGAETIGPAK